MSPTWEALYNAADVDGLAGLYAEDAVIMPPDAPAATGAAAMRANVEEAYLGFGLVRSEVPVVEAYEVSGDLAWGAGPYRFYDGDGNLAAWRIHEGAKGCARTTSIWATPVSASPVGSARCARPSTASMP